jgi:sulfoxide reductase catalytic subunit YedY
MPFLRQPSPWDSDRGPATPEDEYLSRRRFLERAAWASGGVLAWSAGCRPASEAKEVPGVGGEGAGAAPAAPAGPDSLFYEPESVPVRAGQVAWGAAYTALHPGARDPRFVLDRALTRESVAAGYNNFYEFTDVKDRVWRLVEKFEARPWTVEIRGRVETPRQADVEDLVRRLGVEERLYRHRCVEAWAMAVPWSGIPLRRFVEWARPLGSARYLRMVSFHRRDQGPGFDAQHWYPWPYFEGLRLDEARNELAFLATGIYGHPLPKQHGAPIRLVLPWKYGFKSIKSVVLFEFAEEQPGTFWNEVAPREYDFLANVNPAVPHPRWSQAEERMIGTDVVLPTQPYNGYGEWVAHLYG